MSVSAAVSRVAERRMHADQIAAQAVARTRPATCPPSLPTLAAAIAAHLRAHFPQVSSEHQVLTLAEETGEFADAYRRWAGLARRTGTFDDMAAELADVVITAYVAAAVLGIDLDAAWRAKTRVILTRGWRTPPPAA